MTDGVSLSIFQAGFSFASVLRVANTDGSLNGPVLKTQRDADVSFSDDREVLCNTATKTVVPGYLRRQRAPQVDGCESESPPRLCAARPRPPPPERGRGGFPRGYQAPQEQ